MSRYRNEVVTSTHCPTEISNLLTKLDKFSVGITDGRRSGRFALFSKRFFFFPLINATGTGHERLAPNLLLFPEMG